MTPVFRSLGLAVSLGAVAALACAPAPLAAQGQKIRFGVGPLQPTLSETTKAFEPFSPTSRRS